MSKFSQTDQKLPTSRITISRKNLLLNSSLVYTIISGVILEILCFSITYYLGNIHKNILLFTFLYAGLFIVYFFAIYNIFGKDLISDIRFNNSNMRGETIKASEMDSRIIFWTIIAFSIIFRLTLLPVVPSDDIYRYLWEGKLQLNWINPYSFAPDSQTLEQFRDKFYSGINHKHLTTIYPPLTLMSFAVSDYISYSILAMKSIFVSFDLLVILVLNKLLKLFGKRPLSVIVYAWSPLVLISFAARGHCDSLQIFFAILALYLYISQNKMSSVVSVAFAVLSKFISIIVVPLFILRNRPVKSIIVLSIFIFALYIPYLNAGGGLFSTLFHFGSEYHFNDSGHFLILCLTGGSADISKIVTCLVFGGILLYLYKRFYYNCGTADLQSTTADNKIELFKDETVLRYSFYAIATFLILSPTVHPWYLTWIIPFLCFYHSKAWLILTGTVIFYYLMNHELFSTLINFNNEWVWTEVHWLKLPEYLPFSGILIYEYFRNRKLGKRMNVL